MDRIDIEKIADVLDEELRPMMHNLKEIILQRRRAARIYLYSKNPLSEQEKTTLIESIKYCTNNIKLLLGL